MHGRYFEGIDAGITKLCSVKNHFYKPLGAEPDSRRVTQQSDIQLIAGRHLLVVVHRLKNGPIVYSLKPPKLGT